MRHREVLLESPNRIGWLACRADHLVLEQQNLHLRAILNRNTRGNGVCIKLFDHLLFAGLLILEPLPQLLQPWQIRGRKKDPGASAHLRTIRPMPDVFDVCNVSQCTFFVQIQTFNHALDANTEKLLHSIEVFLVVYV